ncbi:MAG: hypothetical protein U0234_17450 [Sandaracinus sp.]
MAAVEVLLVQPGASLGTFGSLVIAVTDGPSALEASSVRVAVDTVARLRRTSHAQRLIYVYVVGERSGLPSDETRAITAELAGLVDAVVGVHEGQGFRASVVRGIVVGISMLSRSRMRPEVVSTVAEAAAKLAERHPDLGSESAVRAAIEQVRGAVGPDPG